MDSSKICKSEHRSEHSCNRSHSRRGPSSFGMHDSRLVFEKLNLKEGNVFLDLGCGVGDYSFQASKIVGDSGIVYALDLWQEMLDGIYEEAAAQGLKNIHPVLCDIRQQIDVQDKSIDVCLISTVLHTMDVTTQGNHLFSEIRRIIKLGGKVAVIECKKEDSPFGPPMNVRISPEELQKIIEKYGFIKDSYADLGRNYFMQFLLKDCN